MMNLTIENIGSSWGIGDFLKEIRGRILLFASMVASRDSEQQSRSVLFDHTLRDYGPMIDRICFGYADSREAMADLRQDSLLNLWESMPRYRGECSMKTWVYRITLNTCVSTIRKRSRQPKAIALTELYDDLVDDDSKELLSELHEAISELSPIDKAIMVLWLDETSYDEISFIMGLPKSTVTIRLYRAKQRLKSIMNNYQ